MSNILFGIDPGSIKTGFGVIEVEGNSISHIGGGVIKPPKGLKLPNRIEYIFDKLTVNLEEFKPDVVAVEEAFYAKNVHTTLVLGHARGIALLAAQKSGAQIMEFSPREIKKAVVGNGNADKSQVEFMVKTMLGLHNTSYEDDFYDALAAAICAFTNFGAVLRGINV